MKINCNLKKNKNLRVCNTAVRGIIKRDNKILLIQRANKSKNKGYWEFPGGKTDGENPKKAFFREIEEETGLIPINIKKKKSMKDGKYYVNYYEANGNGNIKLQKSEAKDYGWFTKNQAKKLKLVNHTRRLI